MRSQLSIREVTVQDLDVIRGLYFDVWGYNRPASFDRWRFFSNPLGLCPAVLATIGDQPVGFYTIWPATIKLRNEDLLGGQSMDTMTHPSYQGQGIFGELANACYELAGDKGYQILYGFPNPLSYPGFTESLGWQHTGDITHWVRPIRPSGHPSVPTVLGPIVDFISDCFPKGATSGINIRIEKPSSRDLVAQLKFWCERNSKIRISRTPDWLEWRYAEVTENDYEWICAYRGDSLSAFGVWGMQNNIWSNVADSRAHLVELMGEDDAARQAVLSMMIDRARENSAIVLETISNVEEIVTSMRRAGFIRHRQAPLIVRRLGAEKLSTVDVFDHDMWQITGGDVDTF